MAKILKVYRREGNAVIEETFLVSLKKTDYMKLGGSDNAKYSRLLVESKECVDSAICKMFSGLCRCPNNRAPAKWGDAVPYYMRKIIFSQKERRSDE